MPYQTKTNPSCLINNRIAFIFLWGNSKILKSSYCKTLWFGFMKKGQRNSNLMIYYSQSNIKKKA